MYVSNMPASLVEQFPTLVKVIDGEHPKILPWYRITQIKSKQGKTFTSFAKFTKYGQGESNQYILFLRDDAFEYSSRYISFLICHIFIFLELEGKYYLCYWQ